jgi:hypothetical protein
MAQEVIARLILRSLSGGSMLDAEERITKENVADYRADEELLREAQKKLVSLGFRVQHADQMGISFSADRTRFEEVFGTRLESREKTMLKAGGREAKRSYLEATEQIRVPDELASVAVAVALPQPPELVP